MKFLHLAALLALGVSAWRPLAAEEQAAEGDIGVARLQFKIVALTTDEHDDGVDAEASEALIAVVRKRLTPRFDRECEVSVANGHTLEVRLGKVRKANVAAVVSLLEHTGSLEFRILASDKFADHAEIMRAAHKLAADERSVRIDGGEAGRWVRVTEAAVEHLQADWDGGKDADAIANPLGFAVRTVGEEGTADRHQILVLIDDWNVDSRYLESVERGFSNDCFTLNLTLDDKGGKLLGGLTTEHQPDANGKRHHLAVIFGGKVETAPTINSVITTHAQITGCDGPYDAPTVDTMIDILRAGRLPRELKLKSQEFTPSE